MPKGFEANGLGFISNPYSRFPRYTVAAAIGAKEKRLELL
jgi:hypothetical protein